MGTGVARVRGGHKYTEKVFWLPETSSLLREIKEKHMKRQLIGEDWILQGLLTAGEGLGQGQRSLQGLGASEGLPTADTWMGSSRPGRNRQV